MGVSAPVAIVMRAFSLRVKALFFAMITLAFAEFALILAVQWSALTGGEDGLSPKLPGVFGAGASGPFGLSGRLVTYYTVLAVCLGCFLTMRRFVHSPLGPTLQAIRDNELRAEGLRDPTFGLQLLASSLRRVGATLPTGGVKP